MNYIPKQKYEKMYAMLDLETLGSVTKEDFVERNSNIYEGIELQKITIYNISYDEEQEIVTYKTSLDTVAGSIVFENRALFREREDGYKLVWSDFMIFPEFRASNKVKVATIEAKRGEILDRNGKVLAGEIVASSVGIVPRKMKDRSSAVKKLLNFWR